MRYDTLTVVNFQITIFLGMTQCIVLAWCQTATVDAVKLWKTLVFLLFCIFESPLFLALSLNNSGKLLLASSCLSVRLYISMEKIGSHWMDFCEIFYWFF
jgi:hypothetical protein